MIMLTAVVANLVYLSIFRPAIPWAIIPIGFYAIGSALAFPSISLMVMNLFPARRGMAASLSGFVTGMVNVLVAGIISPAVSHSAVWMAVAATALMFTGWSCWFGYRRLVTRSREDR
jgi:DHA1 family bicyclomycin/chloramphenicol resistance-like MFS transporter